MPATVGDEKGSLVETELGGPPVLVDKADVVAESAESMIKTPEISAAHVESSLPAPLTVPESVQYLDVPPAIDPVTMMPMEGAFGGEQWAAENAMKDIGQVTAKVQEVGAQVVGLASKTSKDAAAAVQDLGTKMPGFGALGNTLTNWWSTFDPMGEKSYRQLEASQPGPAPQPAPSSKTAAPAAPNAPQSRDMAAMNVQAVFGLPPEESVIEVFPCSLVQSYRCVHNSFTPELPFTFAGSLCITDAHVCFHVNDGERRIPIKLGHASLQNVSRQKARRGEQGDTLKLHLGADQWLAVQGFARPEDIESALALLEHLCT